MFTIRHCEALTCKLEITGGKPLYNQIDDVKSYSLHVLMEQLKLNQTVLDKVIEAVVANPHWGVSVDGESWSIPSVRLPIWCSIKTYLWNISIASLVIIIG